MKKETKRLIIIFLLVDFVIFAVAIWYFTESSPVKEEPKKSTLETEKIENSEVKFTSSQIKTEEIKPEIQKVEIVAKSEIKTAIPNKEFLEKIGFEFDEKRKRSNYLILENFKTDNYLKKDLSFFVKKSKSLSNNIDISVSYVQENKINSSANQSETSIQVKDQDGNLIEEESSSFSDVSMMPIKVTDGNNFAVNIPYKYKDVEMVLSVSIASQDYSEERDFLLDTSSLNSGEVLFVDF